MKNILLIMIAITSVVYCQNTKTKESENKELKFKNVTQEDIAELENKIAKEKKVVNYFLKFLKKEYVEESEKKLPKLEKELDALNRKFNVAQNQALKKKITAKIIEKKAEIEVEKMWKVYYQAYIIREQSYGKDDKKYMAAFGILIKIAARYKKITAKDFIDPEYVFKQKYAKQIEKMK